MVPMDIINIYENYNSCFNDDLKSVFEKISKTAFSHGVKIYLIGGLVRDLLLSTNVISNPLRVKQSNQHAQIGKIASSFATLSPRNDVTEFSEGRNIYPPPRNDVTFLDIDITVEGNAIDFAKILEKDCKAKVSSVHKDFGTVKIEFPIGPNWQKIDLASTRSESYPKAGHLPHVDKIGCSLKEDVLRRDFTINSLAMSLNQDSFADLINYARGFEDLKNKKIKILHDKSFIDDPTRIIRALKYSTRLGFELDEKTLKLQEEYLNNINYDMCYKRIKQEIKKTFEQNLQVAFDRFIEQGIYKLITAKTIKIPVKNVENLIDIYHPKHSWLVYFGTLLLQIDAQQSKPASLNDGGLVSPPYSQNSNSALNAAPNISFTKYEREVIEEAKSLLKTDLTSDFEIYKAFGGKYIETLLILAALGKAKKVLNYLDDLRKIKIHINGDDLINLGFKPSKKFAEVFDYVLKEKLKNPKMSKADEINLAKSYMN